MSEELKERLLSAFLAEGIIQSTEVMPRGDRYHCGNCSCHTCQRADEDCVCSSNNVLQVINEVFASEGTKTE